MSKAREPRMTIRSVSDYRQDPDNLNAGTKRGRAAVRRSLLDVGAGRSTVSSADDVILAGNQTMREAAAAGISRVVEVETDGDALVVVKRRDLKASDDRARKLGAYGNRASELGLKWDGRALAALAARVTLPDEIMSPPELAALTSSLREQAAAVASEIEEIEVKPQPKMAWVLIGVPIAEWARARAHVAALEAVATISVQSNRDA